MGSSSSSLNKSPIRADSMVNPESPTKDDNSLKSEKNDDVSIVPPSPKKILESPRKSTTVVSPMTANNTPVKSRWSFSSSKKSFGSKDETFFDSQQFLQSDSDDDFHSVNGDFTPTLGNTPKTSFSDRTSRFHNLIFQDKKPPRGSSSPAPLPRRKKLGELFRDSIREESPEGGLSSAVSTPYLSTANSGEFNDNAAIEEKKKKSNGQYHRCLPGFSSCGGSFMEKRKKMSSANAVAVK